MIYGILYLLITVLIELLYFRLAKRYNIIDQPNQRSSHTTPIVRGGGIIFITGLWLWFFYSPFQWPYFVIAATLVAIISFADDIKPQSSWVRILIHLTAILLLFLEVQIYDWSWLLLVVAAIVCIGTLSAFNFMDGINGITGVYAIVNLGTFLYLDAAVIDFTDYILIASMIIANTVFLFFNFRKQARCFAGDVGSITVSFIQIFILLQLIKTTGSLLWPLMFFVFGIDSVITIIYRIKNRENIFKAHRKHLYQFLANELRWDHRIVALAYGSVQLGINSILIYYLPKGSFLVPVLFSSVILIVYLVSREVIMRRIKHLPSN